MQKIDLSDLEMVQLREQLGRLPEPRAGRRQLHPLPTVLTIALAATLAGARGYLAISEYAARLTQTQLKRLRAYFDRTRQRFVGPDDDLGQPCQRRKTASACAGWAAKWRIMLAMDCRS